MNIDSLSMINFDFLVYEKLKSDKYMVPYGQLLQIRILKVE